MRILFCVSNKNLNSSGGMNKVLAYSLPEFAKSNIQYQVVSGKSLLDLIKGLIKILIRNPFKFDYIIFNSLASIRLNYNKYWLVYYFISFFFNWKRVVYWHEMSKYFEDYKLKNRIYSKLIIHCFNTKSTLHLAVSEANSKIIDDFFCKSPKEIVYNTVDLHPLKGSNKFEHPTVINIGTIQEIKGVDIWTDVAIGVCKINCKAHFIWCGTGNKNLKEQCVKKIIENKLEDRIYFLDFINDPRILFHASHLYYLSSRLDSMPLVVLEAMSFGKNIVLYNSGGAIEAVGDLGYLVENFDVEQTIKTINDLLIKIETKEIDVFNKKIRSRFDQRFTKETFVNKFIQALK